jgi:hypothetical protein
LNQRRFTVTLFLSLPREDRARIYKGDRGGDWDRILARLEDEAKKDPMSAWAPRLLRYIAIRDQDDLDVQVLQQILETQRNHDSPYATTHLLHGGLSLLQDERLISWSGNPGVVSTSQVVRAMVLDRMNPADRQKISDESAAQVISASRRSARLTSSRISLVLPEKRLFDTNQKAYRDAAPLFARARMMREARSNRRVSESPPQCLRTQLPATRAPWRDRAVETLAWEADNLDLMGQRTRARANSMHAH